MSLRYYIDQSDNTVLSIILNYMSKKKFFSRVGYGPVSSRRSDPHLFCFLESRISIFFCKGRIRVKPLRIRNPGQDPKQIQCTSMYIQLFVDQSVIYLLKSNGSVVDQNINSSMLGLQMISIIMN